MPNYAKWDDGPYQEPPRPPKRPDVWLWRHMSEQDRQAYDAGIAAYLMAVGSGRWYDTLVDMAVWYQSFASDGICDPNWKQGGR